MREHPFFTRDYWVFAAAEYSPARTAAEVAYLTSVLPAGGRVLDLGCGVGRHAHGLARAGFDVVGVDVSEWAVDQARRGPGVFVAADLTRAWPDFAGLGSSGPGSAGPNSAGPGSDGPSAPPGGPPRGIDPGFDAVVCVQAFGWGGDADQVRLLRRVRSVLRPGGVLVLDHSNATAILRGYRDHAVAEVDGHTFTFHRRFDPLTGRSGGEVRVERPDGSSCVLHDDVRLYHPPEVASLLDRAGFVVEHVDADFTRGAPVTADTRYVQFVATARVSALEGHRGAAEGVDLRWAPDEVEFVQPAIDRAWAALGGVAERARRYDVADPYGAKAAPVLQRYFGMFLEPEQVTCGAGATGLLRSLAALAVDGFTCAGHPEFALAAAAIGAPEGSAVVVVDRPGVSGEVMGLDEIGEIEADVLIVDETCAAYLEPHDSAVRLLPHRRGLVVIRSMSKGYCCGGLRVGFALASRDIASRVREVAAPLAVSALSLDLALALLEQGDVLRPLRDRIRAVKPSFVDLLPDVAPGDPRVPWVRVPLSAEVWLKERGLQGKVLPDGIRLSVPLSQQRREAVFG
ncbi:aminotransferase class I/II-fold pyridoxal phosphate-dependent enzyme [Lentzea chajnantorensis]